MDVYKLLSSLEKKFKFVEVVGKKIELSTGVSVRVFKVRCYEGDRVLELTTTDPSRIDKFKKSREIYPGELDVVPDEGKRFKSVGREVEGAEFVYKEEKVYVNSLGVERSYSFTCNGVKICGEVVSFVDRIDEEKVEYVEKVIRKVERGREISQEKALKECKHIILHPKAFGLFLHETLGHLKEADIFKEKVGREIKIPEWIEVVDCSLEDMVYMPFDDDGHEKVSVDITKNLLHSRETALLSSSAPTGNGRSTLLARSIPRQVNVVCLSYNSKRDEIESYSEDAIFVTGVHAKGGSVGAHYMNASLNLGYAFFKGRVIRNFTINCNVEKFFSAIRLISSDIKVFCNIFLGCRKKGEEVKVGYGGGYALVDKELLL
jgi:predicted Zn-dependent protease